MTISTLQQHSHSHDGPCSHEHSHQPAEEASPKASPFSYATILQKPLYACYSFVFIALAVHYASTQWFLSGGFPLETILANIFAALVSGGIIGAIEGRVRATHHQEQKIMGEPLDPFVERFRAAMIFGVVIALALAAFLELGGFLLQAGATAVLGFAALWAIGGGLLAVILGFLSLWFAFSWTRWCFGEIRWN